MPIDVSARASGFGLGAEYKDYRGGATQYLPQRIAVITPMHTDVSAASTKFRAFSPGDVQTRLGGGIPGHNALRMLLPANGDGVGSIPVTVYPVPDAVGASAATGSVTPSGTQTRGGQYRLWMGGIPSEIFSIALGATLTDALRAMGTAVNAVIESPFKAGYTYGTVTSAPGTNVGNGTVTALSVVSGQAPAPGAWRLVCTTVVANGGVFRLYDPTGGLVAIVTLTPGAGGTTVVTQGGIQFTVTDGSTDFAVGDLFTITVPATGAMSLVTKWRGTSANGIRVTLEGPANGMTFAIVQPTGGLVNPDVTSALAQIGPTWETLIVNTLEHNDTVTLDRYSEWGEGRWGVLQHKPALVISAGNEAAVADCTAITGSRRTDRVNVKIPNPGSDDMPCLVAARATARIAAVANNNPPVEYQGQRLTLLNPGADSVQWDYAQRDGALKLGCSTIEVVDLVVRLSDVVTHYRPTGEEPPAYRYASDIVRLQNVMHNVQLGFDTDEWKGAVLIPDSQATTNVRAKRPSMAKTLIMNIADNLGLDAIISDPAFTKKNCTATIDSQNPRRLNITMPVKLSGNLGIVDALVQFGFYFGQQAAV